MSETQSVSEQLGQAVHQNKALSREGMLERMFSWLFQGLVYAQIWEDPVVDMAALELGEDDHIVCIASGGCNMMSYLSADPASLTAVDLSPAHVALGRLKLAAAQHLPDHRAFYSMFGHADRRENIALFDDHLAEHLDDASLKYWNGLMLTGRRKKMLSSGLYRYGLLGKFIATLHLVTGIAGVKFRDLLSAKSLEEQTAFFERDIAPLYESGFVKFVAKRRASLFGLGIPPAQYDKLAADAGGDVIPVLKERTRKLFCDFPINENYFAWAAANCGYNPFGHGPVPPYLEEQNFETIRAAAPRASIVNRSVTDVLAEAPAASKTAYVLLDAQDWMNDDQLNALWSEITRTAAPGAKAIFRTGGLEDILPGRVAESLLDQWAYNPDTSAQGLLDDRSAIYGGFHVYEYQG